MLALRPYNYAEYICCFFPLPSGEHTIDFWRFFLFSLAVLSQSAEAALPAALNVINHMDHETKRGRSLTCALIRASWKAQQIRLPTPSRHLTQVRYERWLCTRQNQC